MAERTLDDLLRGPTPMMPTATMSTSNMWAANAQPYPDSWAAVQRAMPQLPPMTTPAMPSMPTPSPLAMIGQMAAQQYQPGAAGRAQMQLGASSGMLDPRTAGQTFSHQQLGAAGRSAGEAVGNVAGYAGMFAGAPGAVLGTAASIGGGWLGEKAAQNPLFSGIHQSIYGGAAQDVSMAARLQHGTFGQLQMTGNQAGLGGMGMNMTAGLGLARRFNRMSEQFGQQNPAMAEKLGGGDIEAGKQRYGQDLVNLTRMAGDTGLLDAATNVDQIGDTVQKLFKVLGKLGKVTGDPDFRNNLKQLAGMRSMGYTIDQAADALAQTSRYASAAGHGPVGGAPSQAQLQAGQHGAAAYGAYGLSAGPGVMAGAHGMMATRQMAGAFSPLQQELLGGQQGMRERMVEGQARFAGGPAMQMMLGATMGAGAGGGIELDGSKLQGMLSGGMSMTGLAAKSQGNMMSMAMKMAKQQGRSVKDVMVGMQQRMPEFQSMIAQQMGPERMMDLQMQTMGSLAKGGMGMRAAAQIVGGDAKSANQLVGMATSPEYYERRMVQLREELKTEQDSARADADQRRKEREERRDAHTAGYLGYRSAGRGISAVGEVFTSWPKVSGYLDRINASAAEDRALQLDQTEDAARGIKRVHLSRTMQPNQKILDEMLTQSRKEGLMLDDSGMDKFQRARANMGRGGQGRMTMSQLSAAQEAMGYEEGVGGSAGRTWDQAEIGMGNVMEDVAGFFGGGRAALGKSQQAIRDEIVSKANAAKRRTYEMASAIDRTKTITSEQYSKQLQGQAVELNKAGLPAASTLTVIGRNILNYAGRVGRGEGGKTLNPDSLLDEIAKGLASSGNISLGRAREIVQKNRSYYLKHAMSKIRVEGDASAKAALEETTDVALKTMKEAMDPETMQKELTQAQDNMEERLSKLGITEGGWWSGYALGEEEKVALSGLKDIETPEEQGLVATLAGKESEDKATREAAEAELTNVRLDPGKEDLLKKAKATLEGIRKRGGKKAVGTLANIAELEMKNSESLSGMGKTMKAMRQGKGILDVAATPEAILKRAAEAGHDITGGKISAAGTPESDKTRDVEDRMSMVKELKEQFTGPNGAAKQLSVAASTLLAAAKVMGGSKVDALSKEQLGASKE